MATTQTVIGVSQEKGPSGPKGELHFYSIAVQMSGTYATASKPNIDVLKALQDFGHQGVSAVAVKGAVLERDEFNSSGTRYTTANGTIALSSTGNKVVTWTVHDTGQNGAGSNEAADGTTHDGVFVLLVATEVTKS